MINPYLKAFVPVILTLIASLATVYGSFPWYTPVAAALTVLLTYLVPNTPNPPKTAANKNPYVKDVGNAS